MVKKISYYVALYFSRRWGVWFFRTFSWFIATGYYFLLPWRVAYSYKFYKALIPDKSIFYYLRCAWKQYHNFTNVYIHRFVHLPEDKIEFTKEGWQHLDEAVEKKTGAVIVMSHIGNWELAAQMLSSKGMPIMLYLGAKVKNKEQVEDIHKKKLADRGIKIVTTSEDEKSPFALLEGINFLRDGGIVSMTGDRLWGNQSFVTVNFLDYEVKLPDTPHLFALMTGAPLMTFFVHEKTFGKYHVRVSKGRKVIALSRAERQKTVAESAQIYADELAQFTREHPFEWHHFEPFLGEEIKKARI
ncbi:MAG: lysophospholipid acyltransferase family protein [Syntrophaceae bacterium]|nr:lysophospholipid acyltransferase family protein [Syntrophaceae bacterium]